MQKLVLRMCGGTWDTEYEELLTMFGLTMLKARREYMYVLSCTLYKLTHGHYFYPEHLKNKIFRSYVPSYSLRSSSRSLLWQPTTRTNAFAYSYIIPHACTLYNHLPENIKSIASLTQFKKLLKKLICCNISFVCLFVC